MAENLIPFSLPHRGDPDPRRMALASIGFQWRAGMWCRGCVVLSDADIDAYGLHAGTTPIPACAEQVTIGGAKLVGHAVADADGYASFPALVLANAGGRTLLFQAIEQASCTVSTMMLCTFLK